MGRPPRGSRTATRGWSSRPWSGTSTAMASTTPGADGKTVYGGAVYVVYGGSGVTGSIDLAGLPALIHVGSPSVSTPPSGGIAAVGDIDGDGLADFVVS